MLALVLVTFPALTLSSAEPAPQGGAPAAERSDEDDEQPSRSEEQGEEGEDQPADELPEGLLTEEELAPSEPPPGEEAEGDLPLSLPPLDDELGDLLGPAPKEGLAHLLAGVELFGYGRMRLELDAGRDLGPTSPLATGLSLTGRIGVGLPVGPHRARIVLGDGRRLGPDPPGFHLNPGYPPLLSFVYELNLVFDFPIAGLDTLVTVGRFEYDLADARWIGALGAHPRGLTRDGVHIRYNGELFGAEAVAFYHGPYGPDDEALPGGVGVLSVDHAGQAALGQSPWLDLDWAIEGYGFVFRDGSLARLDLEPLTLGTVGTRMSTSLAYVTAKLGLDGQAPFRDTAPLAPPGYGWHGEGEVAFSPLLRLFQVRGAPLIAGFAEATGGVPTAGRAWRFPNGRLHRHLGYLDLVQTENIANVGARIGLNLPEQLQLYAEARVHSLVDPTGPLYGIRGKKWLSVDPDRTERWAFTEVNAVMRVNLGYGVRLEGFYAIALAGPAIVSAGQSTVPIQRLWLALSFDAAAGS